MDAETEVSNLREKLIYTSLLLQDIKHFLESLKSKNINKEVNKDIMDYISEINSWNNGPQK